MHSMDTRANWQIEAYEVAKEVVKKREAKQTR
jgi:hypothetical protein